jgi:hypothetical protein
LTALAGKTQTSAARLAPGFALGDYRIGQPLWPLRIADAYRADGPKGPATIYVIHAAIAASAVRDDLIAGTRAAAAMPEHKHLAKTIAAGLTGEILWIAVEELEGSLARDLLAKKRPAGLGTRATGNLVVGICNALGDAHHGALASESVIVSRTGRVRVVDLALGLGTLAAMRAGLIPAESSVAPEVLAGAAPSGAGDVYSIGALTYEALVGSPLERGGPRPSDVVEGLTPQLDEVVARACHRDPEKRFGRADVFGEVIGEALTKGGAVQTAAIPKLDDGTSLDQQALQTSLAAEIARKATTPEPPRTVDHALAAALADTTEKWLVTKGKFDYGPFSLADVLKQIDKGEVVATDTIMDKDTGARSKIGVHPLLAPMAEAARQRIDDARRAQAEVKAQSTEKKRGVLLYAVIGLGVVGVAAAVYFIVQSTRHEEANKVAGVSTIDGASLHVTVSEPKPPPPAPKHTGGGGHHGGGGGGGGPGGQNANENLNLDLSDESDDGGEQLDMHAVYGVYSRYGAQLGGCLQSNGAHDASIAISIEGKSGRVNFVKVNGGTAGGLYNCLSRTLRGMQFPSIHGPRTRAEFDISL